MASSANKSFMGIDFGTTSCKFGYFINGKVEIFEDEFGNKSMPSYVAFTKDGRLVGEKAKRQMGENPRNTVFAVKKLMGKTFEDAVALGLQFPFKLVKMDHEICGIEVCNESQTLKLYPEQVAAMLFSKMNYLAEKKLKHPVNAAVISVPPGFNSCQRQATVYAGTIAGFDDVRLVDDSTALATAISYHAMVGRETENVAVVDFGGGFISASMITASKISFKELPSVTLEFGGIDIDENIRDILKKKLMNQNDSINDKEKLRLSAEKAKILLSSQENTTIMHKKERISLTSNEVYYNHNVGPKIVRIIENLKSSTSGLSTNSDIDQVIMTGEFTKSPFVKYQLRKLLKDREIKKFEEFPDGVIRGAVLESAVQRGLVNRRCSDSILNRTVKLDENVIYDNGGNPLYGVPKYFQNGMILTDYSGSNETPIRTGIIQVINKSLTFNLSLSTEYINMYPNKINFILSLYYKLLLFCMPSEYLNEFKSLENIFKDKQKKYEDECRKKLAVINKMQKECFDSCSESFINNNIGEIQKMVTNSSISEHSDLEELEEEINRLSSVREEIVKKYSVYLIKEDYYKQKKRAAEEMERKRAAEEMERKRAAEEMKRKRAAEEMERKRAAEEMVRKRAAKEMERKRAAEEMERKRVAAEEMERKRAADEMERKGAAEEMERKRAAEEMERKRAAEEMERKKVAEEMERKRAAEEMERKRVAAEEMERKRVAAEEMERKRAAEEMERKRAADEMKRKRAAQEIARRDALEKERKKIYEEKEKKRTAEERERKRAAEEMAATLEERRVAVEIDSSLVPLSDVQSEVKESSFKSKLNRNNNHRSSSGGNSLKNIIASAADLLKIVDEDESDDDVNHSGQKEGFTVEQYESSKTMSGGGRSKDSHYHPSTSIVKVTHKLSDSQYICELDETAHDSPLLDFSEIQRYFLKQPISKQQAVNELWQRFQTELTDIIDS